MGVKLKRNRTRLRRIERGQLLDNAKRSHPSWRPSHFVADSYGYHDGKLVHHVYHGKRTLQVAGTIKWPEYVVWATGCNQVIAIEKARFSWTKRPVTCLECLASP